MKAGVIRRNHERGGAGGSVITCSLKRLRRRSAPSRFRTADNAASSAIPEQSKAAAATTTVRRLQCQRRLQQPPPSFSDPLPFTSNDVMAGLATSPPPGVGDLGRHWLAVTRGGGCRASWSLAILWNSEGCCGKIGVRVVGKDYISRQAREGG